MRCPSFAVPSVSEREDLRLAAREQAGAVRARVDADLDLDRTDLVGRATVRAALLDGDLLPHEVLVDRLARLLDARLRRRVLRRLAALRLRRRGADRERKLQLVGDLLEEQVPLRRLELLRVLLGIGQRPQLVAELLPHGLLDGVRALLVEQRVERRRAPEAGG